MEREAALFLAVLLLAAGISYAAAGIPGIGEFRPSMISEDPGTGDLLNIGAIVLAGTALLVIARLLGFRLRLLADLGCFVGAYFLFSIFFGETAGVAAGVCAVAARVSPYLLPLNLTVLLSVEAFALIFGLFLPWHLVILLLAGLAVYDTVSVLYTRHMRFLWFGGILSARVDDPRWRDALAFIFPGKVTSMIGAGDYALPAMLVVSVMVSAGPLAAGIAAASLFCGFVLLELLAERSRETFETGLPGMPTLSLGACLGGLLILILLS